MYTLVTSNCKTSKFQLTSLLFISYYTLYNIKSKDFEFFKGK